jgi:hypothetical protein
MDPIEQRVAALEAEVRELRTRLSPKPRAAPLPIADAIARVTILYLHRGGRRTFSQHRGLCVYLLRHGDTVVYVGRSRTGYSSRCDDHEGKPHDRVTVADLAIGTGVRAETAFEALEAALIAHFNPAFNIAHLTALGDVATLWPTANPNVWGRLTQ